MDYLSARKTMIECQVQPCGVTDQSVLNAFLQVPRELFVPQNKRFLAHSDLAVETYDGKQLWRAADQAVFLQALSLTSSDIVLLIGSGDGYTAAILNMLVETVIALYEDEETSDRSSEKLLKLGYDRVACLSGDLLGGLSSEGPYEAIILNGRVEQVPEALFDQLKDGGRLGAVVGSEMNAKATIYSRNGEHVSRRQVFECTPPELPTFRKTVEFQF